MRGSSRKLLAVIFALVAGLIAAGCGGGGGGGSAENKELNLAIGTGWDESYVVANLTKQLLEEELGYEEVRLQELELALAFEGVANGELGAYQDVWLPNHQANLDAVENDVVLLDPWYQGKTEFGIAVPTYMDITTIPELNDTDVTEILGIEPGAVISERIPDDCEPTYDLNAEYVASSTPIMIAEAEERYNNRENFAFVPWSPHWMNTLFDYKFLEDPEDCLGPLNDGATISTIVNEDLPDRDPVAVAFMENLKLNEEQVNEIEAINHEDYAAAVSTWLEDENNRNSLQPAIDAAKEAEQQQQQQG